MKFTKLIYLFIFICNFSFFNCAGPEVREDDPEDVLEEELRADPEPFKDLKNKEISDDKKSKR